VKVVDVEAIYRYYSAGVIDPAAIQLAIRRAKKDFGTSHVLLVGGDSYDYQNVLGINSVSFIPTNYRRTGAIIAFAPSDAVYGDTDGNGSADVAIGRWPVRTNSELIAVMAKSLSYQSTDKALFISDRSLNGISYASQSAPLTNLLGQNWASNQLSLDSYAPGQAATARADIVSNLSSGTTLLSYFGHSAPSSWSREGLITANLVAGGLFNTVNQPFATVQLGCWGTYFVEPTASTVAHQMLLMPKGAALVLGSSALTESASDLALANALLPRLGTSSFGEALMQSQQTILSTLPDAKDVILGGTLLGDPALR
jgi:Peptidase family C25